MLRVLILGSPTAEISAACADTETARAATLDAALADAPESPPDLAIAMQDWPDQWSEADVNRLMRAFPLARLLCSYGPWCDSDGRNRDLWPPGARVPRELTAARITKELRYLNNQAGNVLPLTAGRDEVFESDCCTIPPASGVRIAIQSPDRAYREMLESAATSWGCPMVPLESEPAVVMWDGDPWDAERGDALAAFATKHATTRILVMMGFIRDDAIAGAHAAGAHAVCPKLAPLSQLAERVRELSAAGMGQRSG